jgi:hypothetical protein
LPAKPIEAFRRAAVIKTSGVKRANVDWTVTKKAITRSNRFMARSALLNMAQTSDAERFEVATE